MALLLLGRSYRSYALCGPHQALHRETSSSPSDWPCAYMWDPRAPQGRPSLACESVWWQTHGVASSCLTRGFAPTTRPQWVVRGLGVLLFVKQGSQRLPQSICGPTDVNSSVFTPSSCNVSFCVRTENMIHFYSRCLRAELVIRSPILISPSVASYYSFGIQITWVFTQASGLEKWGSSEICLTD